MPPRNERRNSGFQPARKRTWSRPGKAGCALPVRQGSSGRLLHVCRLNEVGLSRDGLVPFDEPVRILTFALNSTQPHPRSASPPRDRASAPLRGRSRRVRVLPGLLQLPDRRTRDRPLGPQLPLPRDEEGLADLRVRLQRMFRILGLGFHRVPTSLKIRPPASICKRKTWNWRFGIWLRTLRFMSEAGKEIINPSGFAVIRAPFAAICVGMILGTIEIRGTCRCGVTSI